MNFEFNSILDVSVSLKSGVYLNLDGVIELIFDSLKSIKNDASYRYDKDHYVENN